MPMYDFRCAECGAVREQMAPPDVRTAVFPCGKGPVVCTFDRVLSAPVVQVAMKDRAVCPPLRRYDGTE